MDRGAWQDTVHRFTKSQIRPEHSTAGALVSLGEITKADSLSPLSNALRILRFPSLADGSKLLALLLLILSGGLSPR